MKNQYKVTKISLEDVFSDDMTNPFWSSIQANPEYKRFVTEIDKIMEESVKAGKPYIDIEKDR